MKNLEYFDKEIHTPYEYRASNGDLYSGEIVEFADGTCEIYIEGNKWADAADFDEAQGYVEAQYKKVR